MIPKFRAWDELSKKMFQVNFINFIKKYVFLTVDENWITKKGINEVVLMQSTGLKDRNGVEIFEGDIVHWKDLEDFADVPFEDVVKVEYSDEFMKWIGTETCGSYKDFYDLTDTRGLEVTGNIYENPELLEAIDD